MYNYYYYYYSGRDPYVPSSHLHKIMNGLQVVQVVIMHIHTETEVQSSITSIHNLEIAKLMQKKTYHSKMNKITKTDWDTVHSTQNTVHYVQLTVITTENLDHGSTVSSTKSPKIHWSNSNFSQESHKQKQWTTPSMSVSNFNQRLYHSNSSKYNSI